MGKEQGKYHISKEGKVFRINEDGSFTELGNAEDLINLKKPQKADIKKGKSSKSLWVILSLAIIMTLIIGVLSIENNSYDNNNNEFNSDSTISEMISNEFNSDTTISEVISNEVIEENPDFDEWREHAYNYIKELISSPSKSHYDSPSYSATSSRINAAIDLFYDNRYAEVEEYMFYPAYRQNNATAQYYLGCIYENGNRGITQDSKNAFYWFEQAAKNGHGGAAFYLARDYYNDKENKRYWMQKGAELNDGEAMLALANSYENGDFTEIDLNKAIDLYKRILYFYGNQSSYYSFEAAERLKALE